MVKGYSNYDKKPFVRVNGFQNHAFAGQRIIDELKRKVDSFSKDKVVLALDCYHGVNQQELLELLKQLKPISMISISEANHSNEQIQAMLNRNITNDRVFGVLSCHKIEEFFCKDKLAKINADIAAIETGLVIVYGIGASLIEQKDIIVYADMPRWELQLRMRRNEVANWCADNYDEEILRKYKRAFFIDWRVLDRHKTSLFEKMDYILDSTISNEPKMMTKEAHLAGLKQAAEQPFRVVPFFDPGVWGGQWMKEVCGLDKTQKNFAWCFDCVPEENSLILKIDEIEIEIPSINLVLYQPRNLLGDKNHARFGAEFPIRFDFLDTIDGGNLSLQVHPLTEYIQQNFGMHYTQDESYYMLDAGEDATVYLGVKENINSQEMIEDLRVAETGEKLFDADKYVNCFKAKKHDHFLIPAGTVHCSGKNAMVLEISATPYIFTFKLWDWGRLGLDGRPRPIHLAHGEKVIQFDRDTKWVKENLVDQVEKISDGDGYIEERTGLHKREFIETRRHWFTKPVTHNTNDGVNVLNLVEGKEAVVSSPTNAFEPFTVHYAETFIIPASVGEYVISPTENCNGETLATIKAYVRN
ncbi:class I mannose-6-phosphate isomerase [Paludicola sp. MB14-C6]|uniref:class I mannose-6-phosphate isomerase n=1 Tax=Paludihabitans sp. MB14-C6 TaxID=3070656 RepID=UPI0027DD5558|nr:class I mannose-6-phosphate isomerase [Paludicola sp. MB14-C6]WMJ23899.1 class I mannose-6-phosphate isomerase [Paludicola sp. MB14-C6]